MVTKINFRYLIFFFTLLPSLTFIPFQALAGNPDDLPGWKGETHKLIKINHLRGNNQELFDPSRVIRLSWKPRAFLYKGFLSNEECDHIIALAKNKIEPSTVVDDVDGKSVKSTYRTSYGMFLDKFHDNVIKRIERRIGAWTFFPIENGEAIQVLRYNLGQKYDAHFDSFEDPEKKELGGSRVATVLMYLSNVESGGETVFPSSATKQEKDDSWSECASNSLAVKPVKGDALLFYSLNPDTTVDEYSLHAGCPVVAGVKWSATKWIHLRAFDKVGDDMPEEACKDEKPSCAGWAAMGECEKNRPYMVGSAASPGACRKSCRACPDGLVVE